MTTFALRIKPSVQAELDAAASAEAAGQFYTAFQHLERAHVLGQPATVEHVRVHWRMFRFALRNRRTAEAFGQAWRVVAASLFTAIGLVPEGNTGGSDISGFRRMPVPHDLQEIIQSARAGRNEATAFSRIGATVAVDGGMPQHGHDLPTWPRVNSRSRRRNVPAGRHEVQHDGLVGGQAGHPGPARSRQGHLQHGRRYAEGPAVNSTPFRASKPWLLKAAAVLAASLLTGLAAQALDKAPLRDKWTAQEVATLASMRLKEAGQRPADPSNAYEQRTEAAMLGRAPFNDTRFSVRTDA